MEEKIIKYLRKYKKILIMKSRKEENIYLFTRYIDEISDIVEIIFYLEDKEKRNRSKI